MVMTISYWVSVDIKSDSESVNFQLESEVHTPP